MLKKPHLLNITKGVAMNETFRAFLYGILILAAALIPPTLSVIDMIEKTVAS
jgi:uncharacterized membrane protein